MEETRARSIEALTEHYGAFFTGTRDHSLEFKIESPAEAVPVAPPPTAEREELESTVPSPAPSARETASRERLVKARKDLTRGIATGIALGLAGKAALAAAKSAKGPVANAAAKAAVGLAGRAAVAAAKRIKK